MKRNLLLGFGAGLAFAAGFMLVFPPQQTASQFTKEQLQSAAEAYNMMLISKQEYEEWKGEKEPAAGNDKAPAAPAKPTAPTAPKQEAGQPPAQPKPPASDSTTPTPTPPTSQTPTAAVAPKEKISFRVTPGMNSTDVSSLLVNAGVLPAKNQFIRKLRDRNKLNRIRSGFYQIEKGISEDDLIKLLTTPPRR